MYLWEEFFGAEVRHEFAMAARLGLTDIRVNLVWNDFQPSGDRVAASAMRNLELLLDLAAENGLGVQLALFPVVVHGRVWLPYWLLDPLSTSSSTIISGRSVSRRRARDLFSADLVVSAEHRQVREVMGTFDAHPAVVDWVLGDRLTSVSRPASATAYADWLGAIAEIARDSRALKPLWHGVSSADLIRSAAFEPAAFGEVGVRLVVTGDWSPAWRRWDAPGWAGFLAGYASRLTGSPVLLGGFEGGPRTNWPPALHVSQDAINETHMAGAAGCIAGDLFVYAENLRGAPPFDQRPGALQCGLLDLQGEPTEAGNHWLDAAGQRQSVVPIPSMIPLIESSVRQRDPERAAREVYESMLA